MIDDYHGISGCRQAVTDYRKQKDVVGQIIEINGRGAFWRKLLQLPAPPDEAPRVGDVSCREA